MTSFLYRFAGALALDRSVYGFVEAQRSTTLPAAVIVMAASLAAGIGAAGIAGPDPRSLVLVTGVTFAAWLAWAGLILHVGGLIMPQPQTRVTYGELVRTIGFAAAPGVFQVFALIDAIAIPVFVTSWIWTIAAMVVAVREALDFDSTWHAFKVCVVALTIVLSTVFVLGLLLPARLS
jgi:hypothetical protein